MLVPAFMLLAPTLQATPGDLAGSVSVHEAAQRSEAEDHQERLGELHELADQAEAALRAKNLAEARALVAEALELLSREPALELDEASVDVVDELGGIGWRAQDPSLARVAWTRVVEVHELTLPVDDLRLLQARNNLATALGATGDMAGAHALQVVVLDVAERTLPEDHPDLAAARHNLARTMERMGDLAGARALQETVLDVLERTFPDDHPDLLAVRSGLAFTMESMGDLAGARDLHAAVLDVRERTLPEDHPDLILARGNLAGTMGAMGDLAGARALQEAVLDAWERTLPEDHRELLMARGSLAVTMEAMGDLAGARALQEAVVDALERTYPDDHPDLITARNNLAVTVKRMGDLPGARGLQEAVLDACERMFPEDHPYLIMARCNLAGTMDAMGDLEGARALQEAVLEARERTFPEGHPDLLMARNNVALTMEAMGDLAGARALQEAVLDALEGTLPEDHPDLCAARSNLAGTMRAMGDPASARVLLQAVLDSFERTLPEAHPDLFVARNNLAGSMLEMGDLAGARDLLEVVLGVSERALPEDHPDLLTVRGNLAHTMMAAGDLANARALHEAVLDASERRLPKDHPNLLRQRDHLCAVLSRMEDWEALASQSATLVDGICARLANGLARSSRMAGESARDEATRLSRLLFYTRLLPSPEALARQSFEALELARHITTASEIDLGDREAQAEIEELRWQASALRARLTDLVAAEGGASGASDELASVALERDRIEGRIRERLLQSGAFLERIDMGALSAALAEDAAAVGYRRYTSYDAETKKRAADALLAHVVRGDGTLQRVELGAIAEIEALVQAWRAEIGKPIERGMRLDEQGGEKVEQAARALAERVLAPVLAAAGDDARTLFLCLDDALHLVPLDALPFPGDQEGRLVGEVLDLRVEVSFARLIQPPASPEGGPGLVAAGGASFNSAPAQADEGATEQDPGEPTAVEANSDRAGPAGQMFGPLRETRYEAENLAELFEEIFEREATVFSKKGVSKAALAEAAQSARWLHVATHGYFAPESVRSTIDPRPEGALWKPLTDRERVTGLAPMALCGLALAGANRGRDSLGRVPGILTAEELAGWDLSSCELAVLSACETNVGITRAGQGLQSLQAALHMAGARASITSLWKVDDELTRKLMEDLYTRLWVNRESKAEALWNAKMALRKRGAPTRDWAGWVLVGDPD